MSTALASARRRRAGPEATTPPLGARQTNPQSSFPGTNSPQSNIGVGLTLPQVIAVVDNRLIALEHFAQTQSNLNAQFEAQQSVARTSEISEIPENLKEIIDEYASRFDIIADELSSMKDTIMKLQTYTMEVNKTLMEDRIRILSDERPTPLETALNQV